ncbi:hypothetical protein, partial [Pseudomonas fluvialis]|uniref:hypothetical protein n=1 Tax=Pseudomonas fluvialis TaxID=1793966 RepID=UPI0035AECD29
PLMHGADPEWQWQQVQAGEWPALQARAELRAVSAWLLWQRQLLVSGDLTLQGWQASHAGLGRWLSQQPALHLQRFLVA